MKPGSIEQGVIGGCLGGSIVLLGALIVRLGFDREQAFALVGGVFGIGLTAALAVWIEERKRRTETGAELALFRGALEDMDNALDRLSANDLAIGFEAQCNARETAFQDFTDGNTVLKFANDRTLVATRDLNLFRATLDLQRVLARHEKVVAGEIQIFHQAPLTPAVLQVSAEIMTRVGGLIRPALLATIIASRH